VVYELVLQEGDGAQVREYMQSRSSCCSRAGATRCAA
jgi:hypothetical protein